MNILHRGPNNREATRLGCESINLVGARPVIAEGTFESIGAANGVVHHRVNANGILAKSHKMKVNHLKTKLLVTLVTLVTPGCGVSFSDMVTQQRSMT